MSVCKVDPMELGSRCPRGTRGCVSSHTGDTEGELAKSTRMLHGLERPSFDDLVKETVEIAKKQKPMKARRLGKRERLFKLIKRSPDCEVMSWWESAIATVLWPKRICYIMAGKVNGYSSYNPLGDIFTINKVRFCIKDFATMGTGDPTDWYAITRAKCSIDPKLDMLTIHRKEYHAEEWGAIPQLEVDKLPQQFEVDGILIDIDEVPFPYGKGEGEGCKCLHVHLMAMNAETKQILNHSMWSDGYAGDPPETAVKVVEDLLKAALRSVKWNYPLGLLTRDMIGPGS